MSRFADIVRFIEFDLRSDGIIEPEKRRNDCVVHIKDVIATYRPSVIAKAGLGRGELLMDIARDFTGTLVVIEPSFTLIREFMERHRGDAAAEKIKFVNGDFKLFPLDYYAVDCLVCIDYFDLLETGPVMDEFRRALQFDGMFVLGQVVLQDGDLEGAYDDLMREMHLLHTDYYLEEDLKTVMDLKEFSFIKGNVAFYEEDLGKKLGHLAAFYKEEIKGKNDVLARFREDLAAHYAAQGDLVKEPYFIGVFQRRKVK